MRVVLLKGQSQYGAMRLNLDRLAAAFGALGHDALVVDLTAADGLRTLNDTLNAGVDLAFDFNAIGLGVMVGERNAFDVVKTPYVAALLDHPAYHVARLETRVERAVACFLDRSHLAFANAWFDPPPGGLRALLLPAGNRAARPAPLDRQRWLDERDIPILFTGTFAGDAGRAWADMPQPAPAALDAAVEIALAADAMPAEQALEQALAALGVYVDGDARRRVRPWVGVLDTHIRAHRRAAALDALAAAGAPAHLYGAGFAGREERWPSFHIHEIGAATQTLDLLLRARLCLNINANFVDGAHERAFTIMINGAVLVGDGNPLYRELFRDGEDALFYDWTRLDDMPAQALALLDDPGRMVAMAFSGRAAVERAHDWTHRARQIIDLGALARL